MDPYVLLELIIFFGGGIAVMAWFGYGHRRGETARERPAAPPGTAASPGAAPGDRGPATREGAD